MAFRLLLRKISGKLDSTGTRLARGKTYYWQSSPTFLPPDQTIATLRHFLHSNKKQKDTFTEYVLAGLKGNDIRRFCDDGTNPSQAGGI